MCVFLRDKRHGRRGLGAVQSSSHTVESTPGGGRSRSVRACKMSDREKKKIHIHREAGRCRWSSSWRNQSAGTIPSPPANQQGRKAFWRRRVDVFLPPPFYNFFFFKERRLTHAPRLLSPRPPRGPARAGIGRGEGQWPGARAGGRRSGWSRRRSKQPVGARATVGGGGGGGAGSGGRGAKPTVASAGKREGRGGAFDHVPWGHAQATGGKGAGTCEKREHVYDAPAF